MKNKIDQFDCREKNHSASLYFNSLQFLFQFITRYQHDPTLSLSLRGTAATLSLRSLSLSVFLCLPYSNTRIDHLAKLKQRLAGIFFVLLDNPLISKQSNPLLSSKIKSSTASKHEKLELPPSINFLLRSDLKVHYKLSSIFISSNSKTPFLISWAGSVFRVLKTL